MPVSMSKKMTRRQNDAGRHTGLCLPWAVMCGLSYVKQYIQESALSCATSHTLPASKCLPSPTLRKVNNFCSGLGESYKFPIACQTVTEYIQFIADCIHRFVRNKCERHRCFGGHHRKMSEYILGA